MEYLFSWYICPVQQKIRCPFLDEIDFGDGCWRKSRSFLYENIFLNTSISLFPYFPKRHLWRKLFRNGRKNMARGRWRKKLPARGTYQAIDQGEPHSKQSVSFIGKHISSGTAYLSFIPAPQLNVRHLRYYSLFFGKKFIAIRK